MGNDILKLKKDEIFVAGFHEIEFDINGKSFSIPITSDHNIRCTRIEREVGRISIEGHEVPIMDTIFEISDEDFEKAVEVLKGFKMAILSRIALTALKNKGIEKRIDTILVGVGSRKRKEDGQMGACLNLSR